MKFCYSVHASSESRVLKIKILCCPEERKVMHVDYFKPFDQREGQEETLKNIKFCLHWWLSISVSISTASVPPR